MSQADLELVRRWYAFLPDLVRTDPAHEQAILDEAFGHYLDHEYEVRLPADYPEGEAILLGRAGMVEFVAMLRDIWSGWRFEPERYVDAGDRIVVFVRVVAEGRGSGVPIERHNTHVVTVRDGRMAFTRVYRDRAAALQAVGLEE